MAAQITRNHDRDDEVAEGAVAFTLTKPVDAGRLDLELTEAMNWRKVSGIVVDGDATQASAKTPVDLWVLRDDVEPATLRSVVSKHKVPTDKQRATEAAPFLEVVAKLRGGKALTNAERDDALRVVFDRLFPDTEA